MLSLSFLPWLLLLLGIVAAIPIVSFVETNRQKKAMAAAAPPEDAAAPEAEGEEVFDAPAEDGFPADAGDGGFGQPADPDMSAFDDDTFK